MGMLLAAGLLALAGTASAGDCRDMLFLPAGMIGFTGKASNGPVYLEAGTNMTWDDASAACLKDDKKLCTSSEYCRGGKPLVGAPRAGTQWAPIGDSPNAWINVGFTDTVCKRFEDVNGFKPDWGADASVDKSYRGLYRCCGGKLPADPPPADTDSTTDRTPIQKTYPCSCHITPEALSEKEKEGLKEAQDKEAYLSELNPAVQCTCTNEENVPLCLSDPKIASKEMTEAFWDVKKADIPIEKIQGPQTFLAEKHDVKVYDKFPEKKPKVSVTTSAEQIESQATLVDLKKTMEEFGADIESAKQEAVAAK